MEPHITGGTAELHTKAAEKDAWARAFLLDMFRAAVAAADPAHSLKQHLPDPPQGRCVVVGAGKAAASMAAAVEAAWPHVPLSGVVVTPYGYGTDCRRIVVLEAGHPLPDKNSLAAGERILASVQNVGPDDLVLALISGGGSAAMCLPVPGLSLEDKRLTNRLLLSSGLGIRTMNAVRRRISAIKGGKLGDAAAPARIVTLAISDIPGDDASAIASGPTLVPAGEEPDWDAVIDALGPSLPIAVADILRGPAGPQIAVPNSSTSLIATPAEALHAAARVARAAGIHPVILGDAIEGESREVAKQMARSMARIERPTVLISGGETTVTLCGTKPGAGGRNTEFALALAACLAGRPGVWAVAADTDGLDGANLGAAGAIVTPDSLARALAAGLDPSVALDAHDSGSFFAALGDLVVTGPTRTNVNDFRAILVLPASAGSNFGEQA
jgi:glycerate 2-kinase